MMAHKPTITTTQNLAPDQEPEVVWTEGKNRAIINLSTPGQPVRIGIVNDSDHVLQYMIPNHGINDCTVAPHDQISIEITPMVSTIDVLWLWKPEKSGLVDSEKPYYQE